MKDYERELLLEKGRYITISFVILLGKELGGGDVNYPYLQPVAELWRMHHAGQCGRVEGILKVPVPMTAACIQPMFGHGSKLISKCWFYGEPREPLRTQRKTLEAWERSTTMSVLSMSKM